MKRSTTTATGNKFMQRSKSVSPSTKTKKPPSRVFGPSSQFSGVGRGAAGDPRR